MKTQNQFSKRPLLKYSKTLLIVFLCSIVVTPALAENQKDKGIDVCHIPPGNPDGLKVLHVGSESALEHHLDHGDRIFGKGLNPDCSGGLSIQIDENLVPDTPSLPGLMGGTPRPVAVLMGPDGRTDEYVLNEFEIKPKTYAELQTFLNSYGGVIARDDVTIVMTATGAIEHRSGGGWYLVRIDPQSSSLLDLPDLIAEKIVSGAFRFSSEAAARTLATLIREEELTLTPNLVFKPHAIREHPLVSGADPNNVGDYIDFAQQWWMTEDDDPVAPGDQGVSIGVVRAWEYLRHTGLPPVNGTWEPARIAIIDNAFALDNVTGIGNPDYLFNPPPQLDLTDFDGTADGPASGFSPWHGQATFGVCCSYPRNLFGGAGTGGEYVRAIPIKAALGFADLASAVRSAWLMGADVINLSLGAQCNWTCDVAEFFNESHMQEEIITATVFGAAVIASAGNGPDNGTTDFDIADGDWIPCEMSKVICVGAIDQNANNVWNWGSGVDIWAPTNILSTTSPASAGRDSNDWGTDELITHMGTSAASPFVAGIAGLLKTAEPTLRWDIIQQVLQDTSNTSGDFRVPNSKGYVDALRAVQAVRANPPPTARFNFLDDGDRRSWAQPIVFDSLLADPPAPRGFVGSVLFESDIEGEICTAEGDSNVHSCEGRLQTLGNHLITLTATDEFGAMSEPNSINLEIVNRAPSLTLLSPADGTTRFSDQLVSFRAQIRDDDFELYVEPCPPSRPEVACADWSSSLDGDITPTGPGTDILNFTDSLSLGTHTITVRAIDGKGETDAASAVITVIAGIGTPSANIETFVRQPNNRFVLAGSGTDPEDGILEGVSLEWSSDIEGFLGTGSPIAVTLSDGGCETTVNHLITLKVTDSDGNFDTDQITIQIVYVC